MKDRLVLPKIFRMKPAGSMSDSNILSNDCNNNGDKGLTYDHQGHTQEKEGGGVPVVNKKEGEIAYLNRDNLCLQTHLKVHTTLSLIYIYIHVAFKYGDGFMLSTEL